MSRTSPRIAHTICIVSSIRYGIVQEDGKCEQYQNRKLPADATISSYKNKWADLHYKAWSTCSRRRIEELYDENLKIITWTMKKLEQWLIVQSTTTWKTSCNRNVLLKSQFRLFHDYPLKSILPSQITILRL